MDPVVEVVSLSRRFGELKAVDDLSFQVPEGEVYGFLGQNGAGKSTTIRMLLTLVRPTSGSIRLFGKDLFNHRSVILRQVGAMIEKPDLYLYLTAIENLAIMAKLSGVRRSRSELLLQLEKVGIAERADSKVRTFSQGMKQRLGIACALVHEPGLIILDEPTNGLDPQGIADVRNLILRLSREEKKTIFVSSHLLSEIELVADSMLIIDQGRKMAEGKVSELLHPARTLVEIRTQDDARARKILSETQWAGHLQPGDTILLQMHRNDIPQLTRLLVNRSVEITAVYPRHALEDYFLSLTKANRHVAAYPH